VYICDYLSVRKLYNSARELNELLYKNLSETFQFSQIYTVKSREGENS